MQSARVVALSTSAAVDQSWQWNMSTIAGDVSMYTVEITLAMERIFRAVCHVWDFSAILLRVYFMEQTAFCITLQL